MNRTIGKTKKTVFPIGLGAMPLSLQLNSDEKSGIRVIHRALDSGVTFIDTANTYCLDNNDLGHNERLIAKALKMRSGTNQAVVATKGGFSRPHGKWVPIRNSSNLRLECEQSLKNLKVDNIFLYQLHTPECGDSFENNLIELSKLKRDGKISHIGLSNVCIDQIEVALKIIRVESVQNRCHLLCQRDLNNGLLNFCQKNEITYIPYNPVGGAIGHRYLSENSLVKRLGAKYNCSSYNIALSWLLHKGSNIIPIPGASKPESIVNSSGAINISLTSEDILQLNQIRGNG